MLSGIFMLTLQAQSLVMESVLENPVALGFAMCFVAFFISYGIYPLVLRMARVWKIYDNPGERKLQVKPIPVFGGMVVFISICASTIIFTSVFFEVKLLSMLPAMAVLFVVGVLDDKYALSPYFRLVFEVIVVLSIVLINGNYIDNLNGIWGIWQLNDWIAIPLSVIAGVGIINAINLIDGVDGYSSGYAIMVCLCLAVVFYLSGIDNLAILSLICVGALVPFFMHNVFGKTTKMFIGDGGALMIGTLVTIFCFSIIKVKSFCVTELLINHNVGLIPMMLAILSVCVFDTLRVMFSRIFRRESPFHADKTHMHHLFIDLGYSHYATTMMLITINIVNVFFWFVSWLLGASVELQLYVVILVCLFNSLGLYTIIRHQQKTNGLIYRFFSWIGRHARLENTSFWSFMCKLVDDNLFEQGKL